MMLYRAGILVILLACPLVALSDTGLVNAANSNLKNTGEIQQPDPGRISGRVTDTIDAAGYTYAEVDTGKEKVWAAASTTPLKIGDVIAFTTEMPMMNFHSNSLNRDFPVIYFVNRFITEKEGQADTGTGMASPHGSSRPVAAAGTIEGIDRLEGGHTIAEVYTDKQTLNGKAVRIRGKVTKFTANVMNKNWVHIRDSSTLDDLTLTTDGTAAVDAVVVIEGKLALDRDFGFGYVYPLIVEDARLTKE